MEMSLNAKRPHHGGVSLLVVGSQNVPLHRRRSSQNNKMQDSDSKLQTYFLGCQTQKTLERFSDQKAAAVRLGSKDIDQIIQYYYSNGDQSPTFNFYL